MSLIFESFLLVKYTKIADTSFKTIKLLVNIALHCIKLGPGENDCPTINPTPVLN